MQNAGFRRVRRTVSRIKDGHYRVFGSIEKGLEMSETHEQIKVAFPTITTAQSPTRAYDFSVRCEVETGDVIRTGGELPLLGVGLARIVCATTRCAI